MRGAIVSIAGGEAGLAEAEAADQETLDDAVAGIAANAGDQSALNAQGSTDLASYSYTYPTAGVGVPASAGSSQSLIPNPQSLLSSATTPDGTVNFTYDADGQLTAATYSNPQSLIPNPSESYTYDANGNRTGGGYVIGADNELLSDGTYNYSYDADGNRIERTDIATGAVTDYVWDNRDRLVEVIDRARPAARLPRTCITSTTPRTAGSARRFRPPVKRSKRRALRMPATKSSFSSTAPHLRRVPPASRVPWPSRI